MFGGAHITPELNPTVPHPHKLPVGLAPYKAPPWAPHQLPSVSLVSEVSLSCTCSPEALWTELLLNAQHKGMGWLSRFHQTAKVA